jgi:GDP-L-fucose synthase
LNKIYITGGSGLVGKNLIEALDAASLKYVAPTSREVDLLDDHALLKSLKFHRPDLVIHCAGIVGGIAANMAEPYLFCDQNTRMGLNLVRAAKDAGVERLLNLGSSCMYPAQAENPLTESAILSGYLEPTNEGYALAKIVTSKLCEYVSQQAGVQYKTIIPCNIYGRHDQFDPFRSHMIPSAILKTHKALMDDRSTVEIWGDGLSRREFMYAGDLADFIVFAIKSFSELPTLLNVGLGVDYSINEYYAVIAEVVGFKGEFVHDLSKPTGMKQKVVDISAQRALGWRPTTELARGIQETYDFMREAI